MLDLIFTIGQAGCALFLVYGALLVLIPASRKAKAPSTAPQDPKMIHEHLLYDA
jgi:hypothetical protein